MSSGGGGDGAGARQEEEERRKAEMRRRIDRLYGIGALDPRVPVPAKGNFSKTAALEPQLNAQIDARNVASSSEAERARAAMEQENTKLAEAMRQYYADQLGEDYEEAERKTRFRLARQGLLGGSEEVSQQGKVKSDRDLGATRVDEAVRRAIASLTGQREQERLNAINLVNAGAGDSAVSAAQAGLRNSLENVASAQKADLFSDLFTSSADAITASNLAEQQAALLGRYRDRLSTFFPSRSTSSGRITPSGG